MYVEVQGLAKRYDNFYAVQDLSFGFDCGQICGFVGPNGAGKTTTMRVMATLLMPDRGDVKIGGTSVTLEPHRVRPLLGFMPDYYNTYSNMRVWEYLDFFCRLYGLKGRERRDRLQQIMDFTDLTALKDKPIDGLSKGMKQRLCLGRALLNQPKVLVLDEPAAGLDPRARIELRELLKILRDEGRAILISSHILTELAEICDTVAIIEKGRLVAHGDLETIYQQLAKREGTQFRRRVTLEIQIFDQIEKCMKFLMEQPEIDEVKILSRYVCCTFVGDDQKRIELLRKLVAEGFPILEFRRRSETLEDLFMKLTKGEVQ